MTSLSHTRVSIDKAQNGSVIPKTPSSLDRTMQDVPKQRLVISKISLNNFKSYFGKQEIGPFHK
ncbi:4345_t:CDS:1, partial [Funneliformis mosseae]